MNDEEIKNLTQAFQTELVGYVENKGSSITVAEADALRDRFTGLMRGFIQQQEKLGDLSREVSTLRPLRAEVEALRAELRDVASKVNKAPRRGKKKSD